jgi:hypothetical protein
MSVNVCSAPGSHNHSRRDWRRKYNDKYRTGCREEEKIITSEQV